MLAARRRRRRRLHAAAYIWCAIRNIVVSVRTSQLSCCTGSSTSGRAERMLNALRRWCLGPSSSSTRAMASEAVGSEAERLFAALFPGQRYSPDQAAALAARLRQAADSLDAQQAPEADADEPLTKKRKKELRGRGARGYRRLLPAACSLLAACSSAHLLPNRRRGAQARSWTSRRTRSGTWRWSCCTSGTRTRALRGRRTPRRPSRWVPLPRLL